MIDFGIGSYYNHIKMTNPILPPALRTIHDAIEYSGQALSQAAASLALGEYTDALKCLQIAHERTGQTAMRFERQLAETVRVSA
jgi:hypothetical protein